MKTGFSTVSRIATALLAVAFIIGGAGNAWADPQSDADTAVNNAMDAIIIATNVVATGTGPTTVFVSWTNTGKVPSVVGFRVEMSDDEAGPFVTPSNARPIAPCIATCSTSLELSSPSDTIIHWFRVVPILRVPSNRIDGPSGVGSATTPEVAIRDGRPSEPDPAMLGPVAPTNLQCNGDSSCQNRSTISLSWEDNSDEQQFWIMRAVGTINPSFGVNPYRRLLANATTYSETIPELGTSFFYRVAAVRQRNIIVKSGQPDQHVVFEQSFSNSVEPDSVRVDTPPLPEPATPSGLTAVFTPPSTATLTWTDSERNLTRPYIEEDGWFVDWGPGGKSADFEATISRPRRTGQGTVTYQDTNIKPDTRRCYRVRSYRVGPSYSGFTPVQDFETDRIEEPAVCVGAIPKAPTALVATAISNAQVDLNWVDNSGTEDFFDIQRCTGVCTTSTPATSWDSDNTDTDIDPVGTVLDNVTAFSDTSTSALTTYSYRILAGNGSGRSAPSNIVVVRTPVARVPSVSGFAATATGSHEITTTWDDNVPSETGFRLEFHPGYGGDFGPLVTVPAFAGPSPGHPTPGYVDADVTSSGEERCYQVRAVRGTDVSDPSPTVCATTLPPAVPNPAPDTLTATVVSNTQINLSWMDNSTNEDKFRIEYQVFPDLACSGAPIPAEATFRTLAVVLSEPSQRTGTGPRSYSAFNLVPHTSYFFRVVAVNRDGESAYGAATVPAHPVDHPTITTCSQTFGPPRPVYISPQKSGDVAPTKCYIEIQAPAVEADRMRLTVLAYIPGAPLADSTIVYAEAPTTGDTWHFVYSFRKGPNYQLRATSFGFGATAYSSAEAVLSDFKVLADCPTGSEIPIPP